MDRTCLPKPVFQRIVAIFIRTQSGELLHSLGPLQAGVKSAWEVIKAQLPDPSLRDITHVQLESNHGNVSIPRELIVFETGFRSQNEIIGIILQPGESQHVPATLDSFFSALILNSITVDFQCREHDNRLSERQVEGISNAIVDHFDKSLRYSSFHDEWKVQGRDYFLGKIRHFVSRGQRIEFCLPAFPCKSSNLNKVLGVQPDRGEYIALTNLNLFVQGIERIYSHGAKLWIISDGHVFSDCIGVDDAVVDAYGAELIQMNDRIAKIQGGKERIGFKSLIDIFALTQSHDWSCQTLERHIPQISHHISTKLEDESELCRRILMMGFQADGQDLRQRIESKEASILALYRGFSKFMLEDLNENIYTRGMSRTQRRKLSSKVAFEMIQRNQAYSNLVEILFPHHVRLSIHAHPNSGPKFGIQMFGAGVRATNLLSADGSLMESSDLLHIPTPWHNCIAEIQGHKNLYVTRSCIARSALSNNELQGGPDGASAEEGQYFHFTTFPAVDRHEETKGHMKENPDPTTPDGKQRGRQVLTKERGKATAGPSLTQGLRRVLGPFWNCMR